MRKIVFIALLFATACTNNKGTDTENPNVIFIMMDDFGYSQIACNSEHLRPLIGTDEMPEKWPGKETNREQFFGRTPLSVI